MASSVNVALGLGAVMLFSMGSGSITFAGTAILLARGSSESPAFNGVKKRVHPKIKTELEKRNDLDLNIIENHNKIRNTIHIYAGRNCKM